MYQKFSTSLLTHYSSPLTTLILMDLMIKMKLALTMSLMIIELLFYDGFPALLTVPLTVRVSDLSHPYQNKF